MSSLTPCLFPSCCLQAILRPTYCSLLMPVGISVMITFAQSGSVISIQQAPASQPPEKKKNVILWGWLCIYFHAKCFILFHVTDLNLLNLHIATGVVDLVLIPDSYEEMASLFSCYSSKASSPVSPTSPLWCYKALSVENSGSSKL